MWNQVVLCFSIIKWIERLGKFALTKEAVFVFTDEPTLHRPDDKGKLPLPTAFNCSHQGKINEKISGNSVRDISSDTFQKEENDLSSKSIFYIGGSSSEESSPQSPPPTYEYGLLQDACWSSTQLREDFGFEKQSTFRPVPSTHIPGQVLHGLQPKLNIILSQNAKLSESHSSHKSTSDLTLDMFSNGKEFKPFRPNGRKQRKIGKNDRILANYDRNTESDSRKRNGLDSWTTIVSTSVTQILHWRIIRWLKVMLMLLDVFLPFFTVYPTHFYIYRKSSWTWVHIQRKHFSQCSISVIN